MRSETSDRLGFQIVNYTLKRSFFVQGGLDRIWGAGLRRQNICHDDAIAALVLGAIESRRSRRFEVWLLRVRLWCRLRKRATRVFTLWQAGISGETRICAGYGVVLTCLTSAVSDGPPGVAMK